MENNKTKLSVVTPYEHWASGMAEAAIRILTRRTRIALAEAGLPHEYWSAAILWCSPHRNFEQRRETDSAPYQQHLDADTFSRLQSRMRCFGCRCYYVEAQETTSKLLRFQPRRRAGFLLGQDPVVGWGYIVQDSETGKLIRTVQLLADESNMTTFRNYSILNSFTEIDDRLSEKMRKIGLIENESNNTATADKPEELEGTPASSETLAETEVHLETLVAVLNAEDARGWETMVTDQAAEESWGETKSRHEATHSEAPKQHGPLFGDAKAAELDSWEEHGVLDKTAEYRGDGQVLTARWVLTWKPCGPGETDWEQLRSNTEELRNLTDEEWRRLGKTVSNNVRPKARLCVRGFLERILGMVSSPTGDIASLRLILSLICGSRGSIRSFDVKTAFLRGAELERSVWIRTPIELQRRGYPKFCKLKKPAYGLSDAPLAWFVRLASNLERDGWVRSTVDSCIFIKSGGVIFLHVDDGLYGIAVDGQQHLLENLFKEFEVNPKSVEVNGFKFCGVWISQDKSDYSISLSQERYIETIGKLKFKFAEEDQLTPEQVLQVQGLAGELSWVGLRTRPEIMVTVAAITAEPNTGKSVKQASATAEYLRATKTYKLLIHPINPADVRILTFIDANHGQKRNRGGQLHVLVNRTELAAAFDQEKRLKYNLIFARSAKLNRISVSSFHSELLAVQAAADYAISLQILLQEILSIWGYKPAPPPCLLTDARNLVACARATQPHATERRLLVMQLQEFVREGELTIEFISNAYQMADMLTKTLPRSALIIKSLYEHTLRLKITPVWGPTYAVERIVAFCYRVFGWE